MVIAASPLAALTPTKAIRQYVESVWQDQLPHSTVLALAQTRDGYLWAGTYEGLARFNGNDFTVFDKHNTSLESAAISALLPASDGTLWIGTINGGLYRFASAAIARVGSQSVGETIRAVAEDREGSVWVASDRGIARLARSDGRALQIPPGAPQISVRAICAVGDDVWFATDGEGLTRYSAGRFVKYTSADGLSSNVIFALLPAADGRLFIGTQRGGIDVFADGHFSKPASAAALATTSVFAFTTDRDNNLWITAEGNGLCRISEERVECEAMSDSSVADAFRSMLVDREGNLWLGGTSSGLHRLADGKFATTTSETGSNSIRSVTESGDGTIRAGVDGGGLQKIHEGRLVADPASAKLPSAFVRSVLADRDGSLWVGSIAGLTHIAESTSITYSVRDGLATSFVYALDQSPDGSLWIGTSGGVSRYREGSITTIPSDGSSDVRALHEDRAGHLWIGTRSGLRCLENDRVTPCGEGILRSASIFAFHDEADGTLWIGTDRGLARIHNRNATFYTTKDGLFDDIAFAVLEDDDGSLWMSCNKGIYRVRKSDIDAYDRHAIASIPSESYDKSDGMAATQCNGATQPAAWKSRDGRLWFPTVRGLVSVDPKHLAVNALPPPVVIEQVVINGRPAASEALPALAPGSRDLEFHYAALSFVAPDKVRFRYMLDGFDRGWINAGRRHVAYYTNVPSGRYRFRVLAANNDGVWNRDGASLPVGIEPHFYETWWFRALSALVIVAAVTIAYRIRLRQLRENERRLTALVAARTEELREANIALEELATTDALTQVANRRSLDAALVRMWGDHARRRHSLAAILCDVDHFKKYNDTYGHQAGDEALVRVAAALASAIRRSTDIVARFGGEEFLILLAHSSLEDAVVVSETILESVRALQIRHDSSPTAPFVTVSLGVAAIVPDPHTAPEHLVRETDAALYRAKEEGRNRYAIADVMIRPQSVLNQRRDS